MRVPGWGVHSGPCLRWVLARGRLESLKHPSDAAGACSALEGEEFRHTPRAEPSSPWSSLGVLLVVVLLGLPLPSLMDHNQRRQKVIH